MEALDAGQDTYGSHQSATAPLLTGTIAQEEVETDKWPESNLDTTKINNKLLDFLSYKKGKRPKCSTVPHHTPQVLLKQELGNAA